MKTFLRILAILLAITAVGGITYAVVQSDLLTQVADTRGASDGHRPGRGEFGDASERGERPNFGGESGDRDRDRQSWGFDLSALAGFARILLPMALVITAVLLLSLAGRWWRKRSKNQQPPPDNPAPTT